MYVFEVNFTRKIKAYRSKNFQFQSQLNILKRIIFTVAIYLFFLFLGNNIKILICIV